MLGLAITPRPRSTVACASMTEIGGIATPRAQTQRMVGIPTAIPGREATVRMTV
jgi:hypothetical protein